jgi:hypothetical protein
MKVEDLRGERQKGKVMKGGDIPIGTTFYGYIQGYENKGIELLLKVYELIVNLEDPEATWDARYGGYDNDWVILEEVDVTLVVRNKQGE